ncbi:MAG: hypothetical protein M3280_05425 [Actinomycetota bacterium]|nr:hypothetical protein [Actinomycetota bacterium]
MRNKASSRLTWAGSRIGAASLLLALVPSSLIAISVEAVAAPSARRLAATTRITAKEPTSILVSVPRGAMLKARAGKDAIETAAKGPSATLVLSPQVKSRIGPTLMLSHISKDAICAGKGCPVEGPQRVLAAWDMKYDADARTLSIPAGTYRLHLLPVRGPASFTLRFSGLSGSVALRPGGNTDAKASSLDFETLGNSDELGWAPKNGDMPGQRGLVWSAMWLRMPTAMMGGEYFYCLYRGTLVNPGPGCGLGDSMFIADHIIGPVRSWVLFEAFAYPVSESITQKMSYLAGGDVDAVGGVAVSVPFGRAIGPAPFLSLTAIYTRWFAELAQPTIKESRTMPLEGTEEPITVHL